MGHECKQKSRERRREELIASWEVPWNSKPIAAKLRASLNQPELQASVSFKIESYKL